MKFRRDQFEGEPEIGRVLRLPGLLQIVNGDAGTIKLAAPSRRFQIVRVTEHEVEAEELFGDDPFEELA